MLKRPLFALAAAALGVAALNPFAAQAADPPAPVVVGSDAAGDWGGGGNNAAVGDALGQDLASASIVPSADGQTITFVIGVTNLPAPGGMPEVSRYTWNLNIDPTPHVVDEDGLNADLKGYDLDGKFTNYSRGACDPTAGTCPPPRDPGLQPFVLRGDCRVDATLPINLTVCQEKAKVRGVFDAAKKTISIPVPASALGLQPCTAILGGAGTFGGSISAAPSAFVTSSAMPLDTLAVDGMYRVPSGTIEPCPAIPEPEVVE